MAEIHKCDKCGVECKQGSVAGEYSPDNLKVNDRLYQPFVHVKVSFREFHNFAHRPEMDLCSGCMTKYLLTMANQISVKGK